MSSESIISSSHSFQEWYSAVYNLLYAEKDYSQEAQYVSSLLAQSGKSRCEILEFGCGTGRHAYFLRQLGHSVVGVERSAEMIRICRDSEAFRNVSGGARVVEGDIRDIDVGTQFDAVVSLFHVMSYQADNEDVCKVLANAARHLRREGLFIFDVWYGPAVLTQRPAVRVKRVENDEMYLTRIAEPCLDLARNCVHIEYTLFRKLKSDSSIEAFQESHCMRYFSTPEMELFASGAGFDLVRGEEWLTGATPSAESWGVCYVLRKRDTAVASS